MEGSSETETHTPIHLPAKVESNKEVGQITWNRASFTVNETMATVEQTTAFVEPTRGLSEEGANCITHALGLALSVLGTAHLLGEAYARGDRWQFVGCGIYGLTLILLYAASTLSHSFQDARRRNFWRMMDQVCIFLLIAGSFTPFALTYLRDGWLLGLLITMWSLAFFGIFFKVAFRRLRNVSTSTYVVMGWLPIIAIEPIITRFPGMALAWIVAGGLCYTVGTWFLTYDHKAKYFHAVWHLLVIAGSTCHYIAVSGYVL